MTFVNENKGEEVDIYDAKTLRIENDQSQI
jgi:hypothetical protein